VPGEGVSTVDDGTDERAVARTPETDEAKDGVVEEQLSLELPSEERG
jgi:hypothetical protein